MTKFCESQIHQNILKDVSDFDFWRQIFTMRFYLDFAEKVPNSRRQASNRMRRSSSTLSES